MPQTYEFRNKTVSDLIKLGDLLGRSLRENVELFSINGDINEVSYVTQSDKIISGKYDLSNMTLSDVVVEDSDTYRDSEKFDKFVASKAGTFISEINHDNYASAKNSFSSLIKLWEQRLRFNNTKSKLDEKVAKFSVSNDILGSKEFKQLKELFPKLVEHLKTSKKNLEKIPEITNSLKLSNTIARGFNLPKLSYKTLQESKTFKVVNPFSTSIYEMICNQELIKKELIENKNSFSDIWVGNDKIKQLAILVNEKKKDKVYEALANVVIDIPFIALATKKQIYTVLNSAINVDGNLAESLDEKDIKQYATRIFDLCKPVRKALIDGLNEKYGVNILNLKEPVSFKSLLNTQVVLFETLTRTSGKDTVLKEKLAAFTEVLKSKNGVASIDLNEEVYKLFVDAGYKVQEADLTKYLNFDQLAGDIGSVAQILGMIKQVAGQGQALAATNAPLAGAPPQTNPMATPMPTPSAGQAPLGTEDDDVGAISNQNLGPEGEEEGQLGGGMGMNSPDSGGVPEEPAMPMSRDDLIATIQNLDMLTQELKASLGMDDGGDMFSAPGHMEQGMEGEMGMEGEGEFGSEEGGEEGGEGSPFSSGEEEGEESEEGSDEEKPFPKKSKGKSEKKEKKPSKGKGGDE